MGKKSLYDHVSRAGKPGEGIESLLQDESSQSQRLHFPQGKQELGEGFI